MSAPHPFLTARWSNLCIVTYAVPRAALESRLPPGLTLDERDGKCFVSLVAFDFLDVRVRGVRIPGLVNFPEVNLRFYVREGSRRGVCFIRELVPKRLIAWVAKVVYNEPYVTARMESGVESIANGVRIRHRFERGGASGEVSVIGRGPAVIPRPDSIEHFFKEHTWGFGTGRGGGLLRYRVTHPTWAIYRVEVCDVRLDWSGIYGEAWTFLEGQRPESVVLAVGSGVEVYPKGVELATDGK